MGKIKDTANFIGIRQSAREAWDPDDYPEPPPAPGESVSLSFPHLDWERYPDLYTSDFRPPGDALISWDITIEASRSGQARLTIGGAELLPDRMSIALLDIRTGMIINVRESSSHTFAIGDGAPTRHFRLVVAQKEGAASAISGYRQLPERSVLLSPVPNPFNLGTTIGYQVSQAGRVRLGIYDLSGREVIRLRDGAGDRGYATVQWDGRDRYGAEVASGVYVVALEAGGVRSSRKLLLLR